MEEHNLRKHAILSASSAHRWLKCTPSALLENTQGEENCSVYAEEGTCAHELGELKLKLQYQRISSEQYKKEFEEFKQSNLGSKYYSQEMDEFVTQYVKYIKQVTDEFNNDFGISFEQRVDFTNYVPEGFGTADVVLVSKNVLCVIDLKYGQGVPVAAQDNEQLKLYAVGAMRELQVDVDIIKTYIVQPRIYNFDVATYTKKDILEWAENVVKPQAELAIQGLGSFVAGDKQCKWCKLKGQCKARSDFYLDEARKDFTMTVVDNKPMEVNKLTDEQIADILQIAPKFNDWFMDIQKEAYKRAMSGIKVPGYKLVEGRSNRQIINPIEMGKYLMDKGFTQEELFKPLEMKGLSELEKLIGAKTLADECKEFIIKPAGRPSLVVDTDRRPEYNSVEVAKKDFITPL